MTPKEQLEQEMTALLGEQLRRYFPADGNDHAAIWLSQTFAQIVKAIGAGDTVAVAIACHLIERDPMLPFGKLIKSSLARALKKRVELLSAAERKKIVATTIKLLNLPFAPRELEDYCKLVKKFGLADPARELSEVQTKNPKAAALMAYLAGGL